MQVNYDYIVKVINGCTSFDHLECCYKWIRNMYFKDMIIIEEFMALDNLIKEKEEEIEECKLS